MIRNLSRLLAAAAVALVATCLMAGTAPAAVEVANPGPYEMSGTLRASYEHTPGNTYPIHACDIDIDLYISSDGSAAVNTEAYTSEYGYICEGSEDPWLASCSDDSVWPAQIVGPGDEMYTGTGDFELVMLMCTVFSDYYLSGASTYARFSIDQDVIVNGTIADKLEFQDTRINADAPAPENKYWYTGYQLGGAVSPLGITTVQE